jgi:two-component system, NtrC family, response regulator PilR
MTRSDRDNVVLSYNGVDGFCAAAAALLQHPKAELVMTSASKIGRTFASLAESGQADCNVHVCGVGFFCDWEEIEKPAQELKKKGFNILWYCGRGYLNIYREQIARVGTPVFLACATNTEGVCRHLGLGQNLWADSLLRIAASDPNLDPGDVPEEVAAWRDLILAAIASYLKYQDEEACPATIRKLTVLKLDAEDREVIRRYRRFTDRNIIRGHSDKMKELRRLIAKCAVVDEPVILTGESGTGKEYAAQLVHERSSRAGEPFRPVNCAVFAGNPGLANSTLFGHVKGAFTGATADRKGAFLSAAGGTLFLDELGLLPLEVQGKLLRVLEEGFLLQEGSDNPVQIDVRIIAATNRDLPSMIRKGEFLPDLYHRINTLRIELPPLRSHPEDLREIAREKLTELSREGYELKFGRKDYELLAQYDWPGNVRQLFKLIKRIGYLGLSVTGALEEERRLGRLEFCPEGGTGPENLLPESEESILDFEEAKRIYFLRAWELCGKNYARTAQKLGVAVNTLRKYVENPQE